TDQHDVALAAARLVTLGRADHDDRIVEVGGRAKDEPLGTGRGPTATADRVQLLDDLRPSKQTRHRPERLAAEVEIEPSEDDPLPDVSKPPHETDEFWTEELRLVDGDHVRLVEYRGRELGNVGDG